MRFTHPEMYEGRDDFARENALVELLRRRIVRPGMTAVEILGHLGNPSHQQNPEEGGSIWYYEKLQSSGFRIYFDDGGNSRKFIWSYEKGPWVDKPDVWE